TDDDDYTQPDENRGTHGHRVLVSAQSQYSRRHDDAEIGGVQPLEVVMLCVLDAKHHERTPSARAAPAFEAGRSWAVDPAAAAALRLASSACSSSGRYFGPRS